MQVLINDLLAFSRVGRIVREHGGGVVHGPCSEQAEANLADAIEYSGATIEADELPTVRAEVPLLTAVFQNLLRNALKFRREDPPHVRDRRPTGTASSGSSRSPTTGSASSPTTPSGSS